MRNENAMMELIIGVAKRDERIRGVYLSGSRTNSNVPKDVFQDYDFVYVVSETSSFIEDEKWIDVFGERLYMQLPEKMDKLLGHDCDLENCYGYLIQLADGNRIDFHLQTLEYSIKDMQHDRLCVVLLDKDEILPEIPKATDEDHWVKRPSKDEYLCCCNEFWWLLNNVGKGLWRGETPYVMEILNLYSRPQLLKMISWYIGMNTNFTCSIGKFGKYIHRHLSQSEIERFLRTYPTGNLEMIWQSIFEMCDLFHELARKVGRGLGYTYNEEEAHNSRLFLECTYELPGDAKEMIMVRRVKEEDIEEIAQIWLDTNIKTHNFIEQSYWQDNFDHVKKRLYETEIYVYEDHNGIQGFVGINRGYVEGIFVKEDVRGRGIGRALISICKSKYFKIHLHVYCKNVKALDFYMKEEFKINKKQTNEGTNQSEYEMIWRKE